MVEKRSMLRQQTSLNGEILLAGESTIRCIVSDVSPYGAKLTLPSEQILPPSFHLRAIDLNLDALARVMWRFDASLGVRFSLPKAVPNPPDEVQQPAASAT